MSETSERAAVDGALAMLTTEIAAMCDRRLVFAAECNGEAYRVQISRTQGLQEALALVAMVRDDYAKSRRPVPSIGPV